MNKYFSLMIFFAMLYIHGLASVDTVYVPSASMHKDIKTIVIKPKSYQPKGKKLPTVYLLHGAMGNSTNWITKVPDLQTEADAYEMLIVCPDGSPNSWYFDSPVDSSFKFETHVSKEIPNYIDAHYNTIANRKARAIAGLSMGGHGALFIAFRHADIFAACGSMSGALDVSVITRGYDVNKRLGDTLANKKYYQEWSVLNVIEKKPSDSLKIIIDCGLQDFIYQMSKAVHDKMVQLKIPHDYIERPGKHDWPYWSNAVKYQLLFFKEYFKKSLIGF